ncbi:hypothetical protein KC345_g11995, partial [Hortaea werneckii]
AIYWMDKTRYSAFSGTDLALKLRERGITELHLIGVCTDICVLHTAVDAYNNGFDITVHEDAVASFNPDGHTWALGHFRGSLGAKVINMMYAHWVNGTHKRRAVFEAYFRKLPFGNGFAVFAGLERIAQYIAELRFTEDDIRYLSEQEENYAPAFLEELLQFHFQGSIHSMKEGALVFPDEPLVRVEDADRNQSFPDQAGGSQ